MGFVGEACNQYVEVDGVKAAYRWLGRKDGVPLVHFPQFRGTLDLVEPIFMDLVAAQRGAIIFDLVGLGYSDGTLPTTFKECADWSAKFIKALGLAKVDVMGFSMGGNNAQMLALNHPQLVRRLILVAAHPSIGPGVRHLNPKAFQAIRHAASRIEMGNGLAGFCPGPRPQSRQAIRDAYERMMTVRPVRKPFPDVDATERQVKCIVKFMHPDFAAVGSFGRLHELRMPVLMITGGDDQVLAEGTSRLMIQQMKNTRVDHYDFPDVGHCCHWERPVEAAAIVNEWLGVQGGDGGAKTVLKPNIAYWNNYNREQSRL